MSLKDGNMTLPLKFMGSSEDYHKSNAVIIGAPMDYTCSFRPGARFAPQKIREVSIAIEEYSVYLDSSLDDANFYDCGDLEFPIGDVANSLEIIQAAAEEIVSDEKFPLFIGGEHLISVPVIKSLYKKYGDELIVVQFDAHADLRDDYLGSALSHASAIKRLTDFMPGKNIYQFGIRSGTKEEFEFASQNTNLYKFDVLNPLKEVIAEIGKRPVYFTLDIDVADPAYANGTGTPEPGGISSRELIESIHMFKVLNLVGFDLVEVSPHYDDSDRTALLAAKIIRDIVLIAEKTATT
jgi:agmatinase